MSNWVASPSTPRPSSRTSLDRDAAVVEQRTGDAPDEVRVEPLVAGRDRGVDGEHAVAPDVGPGVVERHPGRDVLAGALGEQERRVALVEVPDRRRQAEGADRAHAADAEDELLVEAHLATADVQDVGDRPVGVGVLGEVRVEQEDRDAADLGDPDRDGQVATGQLDRSPSAAGPTRPGRARAAAGSGRSRGSRAPGGRRRRSSGGSSPCDRAGRRRSPGGPCRWPTSCGRRPGRRGRPSRCRATRGSRTRRRSRRSARSAGRRSGAGTSGRSRWPCSRRTRRGRRGTRPGTSRRRAAATIRSDR